jgi:hypothetical protein
MQLTRHWKVSGALGGQAAPSGRPGVAQLTGLLPWSSSWVQGQLEKLVAMHGHLKVMWEKLIYPLFPLLKISQTPCVGRRNR